MRFIEHEFEGNVFFRALPLSSYDNIILAYARKNPGVPIMWKHLDRMPTEVEKHHASEVLSRLARLRNNR